MSPALAAIASSATSVPLPLLVATFCLFWSSAFSVAKLALFDCPPLLLLTARFLIAAVVMPGAAAIPGASGRKLARRDLIALAGLGIANNALYLGLNYLGMRGISSGLSALIVSTNPVLTALLATLVLDERMTGARRRGWCSASAGSPFSSHVLRAAGV